ncbi:MAG TPA: nucleoside phosphorylase [Acidimicrobiia bacterium]|nr:nucleoside phosphorylase [Acidimicrobiia bacterium]
MPAVKVSPDTKLPILGVRAGDLPARSLVVGDPARAEKAAARLGGVRELGRTREYVTFVGEHRGTVVAVVSHGVGSAGAAVCFEELYRAGAEVVIRAGTAGGMQPDVVDGDLVVATAAVRSDGYTQYVVPPEFPAVADHRIVERLLAIGRAAGVDVHSGVVLTLAPFYPHDVLGSSLPMWHEAGVVAVEMEAAALFVIASLHGAAAGAILAIDGNPLIEKDDTMEGYNPNRPVVHEAVEAMIGIALDALVL